MQLLCRLSETDWNGLPIFDNFCALLDQIPYFTKAETLQTLQKTPESLGTKGQKVPVGIYFGTSKFEHKYRSKALKSSKKLAWFSRVTALSGCVPTVNLLEFRDFSIHLPKNGDDFAVSDSLERTR